MRTLLAAGLAGLILAGTVNALAGAEDPRQRADALWAEREDPGKAREAVKAYEAILKEKPKDYDLLLRLSRLHYWLGQLLEGPGNDEAIASYKSGEDYGRQASEAGPEKPGGYFFEAANLARKNNLKGKVKSLLGIAKVDELNKKAAAIEPLFFYAGPDRFFCAYYTKLPGLLGGDSKKAIEFGKKAVEAFPRYAGNRVFLAEAYVREGRNDLARKELEQAMALPDDAFPDAIPEQRLEKKRAAEVLKKIAK